MTALQINWEPLDPLPAEAQAAGLSTPEQME
jgi:hypothetical protein